MVHAVSRSSSVSKIFCIPGNPGIRHLAECHAVSMEDHAALVSFVRQHQIDLTLVGPEQPIAEGLVDRFEQEGLKIFGPSKAAGELESSKSYTKLLCDKYAIPTASFEIFDDYDLAVKFIEQRKRFPVVLKADGLAAGKGVVIASNQETALAALSDMMLGQKFGRSGARVVIEDFLDGEEASFIVVADGEDFVVLSTSQDHKRIFDHDEGPNTGGMGAYAPAPVVTTAVQDKIIRQIIRPTLHGMIQEGRRYRGFLYAGLMISAEGDPSLIEFNCRLGDPEAEVILPQLKSDFVDLMMCAVESRLNEYRVEYQSGFTVCVVLASEGYPISSSSSVEIQGLDNVCADPVFVYHAGTKLVGGKIFASGGRVLTVSAQADSLPKAIEQVYLSLAKIQFKGMQFRRDIGAKGLKRTKL